MTTAEKIKLYRIKANVSQKLLADLSGVSESAIRKYEKGERVPKIEQLQKIANALNISSLLLLEDSSLNDAKEHSLSTFQRALISDLIGWIEPYLTLNMTEKNDDLDIIDILECLRTISNLDNFKLRNSMFNSIRQFIYFTMSSNNIKNDNERYHVYEEGE